MRNVWNGLNQQLLCNFLFGSLCILALTSPARANEWIRPEKPSDYAGLEGVTVENAIQVEGVSVAWANYAAIRRDFPALNELSNEQIDQWLIQNFAYIGNGQPLLDGIRNSPIPQGPKRKPAIRPEEWRRSAVLQAIGPHGQKLGMVDVKGFGHGAQSYDTVSEQIRTFAEAKGERADEDRIRALDHSDGLMSLGEAIAETSRQLAAQRLLEMSGSVLETVESYAILALPFDILKKQGSGIRAALYLRQAHQGRSFDFPVAPSIYIDDYGRFQKTETGTAVDFGGVIITDPRLSATFGTVDPNPNTGKRDPQKSNTWKWAHETALAWTQGATSAVYRHLEDMLAPIEKDYQQSPEAKAYRLASNQYRRLLLPLRGNNYLERKNRNPIILRQISAAIEQPDANGRHFYMTKWPKRGGAQALNLIIRALKSPDTLVRWTATHRLAEQKNPKSLELILAALKDPDAGVRSAARTRLAERHEPEAIEALKQEFKNRISDPQQLGAILIGLRGRSDLTILSIIADAIENPEPQVWQNAILAIEGFNDADAVPLITRAFERKEVLAKKAAILALLGRSSPEVFELITLALESKIETLRIAALKVISYRKDPESFALLSALALDDANMDLREKAFEILGSRTDPEALAFFSRASAHPDPRIRLLALRTFQGTLEGEMLQLASRALKGSDLQLQFQAVYALARHPGPAETHLLVSAFQHSNAELRALILRAIDSKSNEALQLAELALKDSDPSVRSKALQLLAKRTDAESIKLISDSLKSSLKEVQLQSKIALIQRTDAAALELISEVLLSEKEPISYDTFMRVKLEIMNSLNCSDAFKD